MSNNKQRGGTGRDLSGPWRRGFPASATPTVATSPQRGNDTTTTNATSPAQGQAEPQMPTSSANYRGDLTNPRNRSADIPDSENCATWWTNLPANCTYAMLFDSMRHVGAVSHAVINPPVGVHGTSAAKVEFFERRAVDRLLAQARSGHLRGHLRVGGRIPHIVTNRIRVAAHSNAVPDDRGNGGRGSRVLRVVGDPRVVRRAVLEALLAEPEHRIVYGLEQARVFVNYHGSGGEGGGENYSCIEFRFASYVVQALRARSVFMAQRRRAGLTEEEKLLWSTVTCVFAADPCE